MNIDEAFQKFTKHRQKERGYEISCTKGLFAVCAPTKEKAIREAKHYFWQYFEDGEYGVY